MDPQQNIRDIAKKRNWGGGGGGGGRTGTYPSELERQNQNLDRKQNGPSEVKPEQILHVFRYQLSFHFQYKA